VSVPADDPLLSTRSGRVKEARKLTRRAVRTERRLFLAEGRQAVREALALPGCVREVFAVPGRHDDLRPAADAAGAPWLDADEAALASLSETVSPQGVVAVCHSLDRPLDDVLATALAGPAPLVVVCADVRDPGNAGTVVRCADAVAADAVVLSGDAVDLHNGKTVRASVGSVFHLPVALHHDTAEVVAALRARGVSVLAADGAGEIGLYDVPDVLRGPVAWLFGNEAWGLPDEVAALADHRVRIPIQGRAESLNLATAAAVCLYATHAARR
jgi:TrmH family RNA methyltransferase